MADDLNEVDIVELKEVPGEEQQREDSQMQKEASEHKSSIVILKEVESEGKEGEEGEKGEKGESEKGEEGEKDEKGEEGEEVEKDTMTEDKDLGTAELEAETEKEKLVDETKILPDDLEESPEEQQLDEFTDEIPPELKRISLKESVTNAEEEYLEKEEEVEYEPLQTRKKSRSSYDVTYNVESRLPVEDHLAKYIRVSGDFIPLQDPHMLTALNLPTEEEEEEKKVDYYKPKKEEKILDRAIFYKKYVESQNKFIEEKLKNSLLQRSMIAYFKKNKMDNMLKEVVALPEMITKYRNKLIEMDYQLKRLENLKVVFNNEVDNIRKKKDARLAMLSEQFDSLQQREIEVGKGLTFTKSGLELQDRTINILINRQRNYFKQLCELRTIYQNTRTVVHEQEVAIEKLNLVGNGLYLFNFEVMKNENRIFLDKIEEKEEELSSLRSRSRKLLQMLAHIREKSNALDCDMEELRYDVFRFEGEIDYLRRRINDTKQERDWLRQRLEKLKIESGLLSETALIRDMEKSLQEVKLYKAELKQIQENYVLQTKQLRNLRKTREKMETMRKTPVCKKGLNKCKMQTSKVRKSRPSILYPAKVPSTSFHHLKEFAPVVTKIA